MADTVATKADNALIPMHIWDERIGIYPYTWSWGSGGLRKHFTRAHWSPYANSAFGGGDYTY